MERTTRAIGQIKDSMRVPPFLFSARRPAGPSYHAGADQNKSIRPKDGPKGADEVFPVPSVIRPRPAARRLRDLPRVRPRPAARRLRGDAPALKPSPMGFVARSSATSRPAFGGKGSFAGAGQGTTRAPTVADAPSPLKRRAAHWRCSLLLRRRLHSPCGAPCLKTPRQKKTGL